MMTEEEIIELRGRLIVISNAFHRIATIARGKKREITTNQIYEEFRVGQRAIDALCEVERIARLALKRPPDKDRQALREILEWAASTAAFDVTTE